MLPKEKRLNLKKDFKWAASGRKLQTKNLTLFIKTGDNLYPRVGIAVSSKVFKKSTLRNKAKRIASSGFEKLYIRLPSNINILVLPKESVFDVKSEDLYAELESLFSKEQILKL